MDYRALIAFLFLITSQYANADSTLADKVFIENADQFSEEFGVRLHSSDKNDTIDYSDDTYVDPNLVPYTKLEESVNRTQTESSKKKKVGLSFASMARRARADVPTSNPFKFKKKKVGFTFSQLAEMSQKEPSANVTSKRFIKKF